MKVSPVLFIGLFFFNAHTQTTDLNKLSENFIKIAKKGGDTQKFEDQLTNLSVNQFEKYLDNDTKRIAFWVNVYNAFILVKLTANPEAYEKRNAFFAKPQLLISGENISFSSIEHGILRKSQWDKGLGYIRKWFVDEFERKLRVDEVDYRIHFALNCGAKDCPPVAIYTPERLEEQLKKGTTRFLKSTTAYDSKKKEATVTTLFSWFRGDFGGSSGIKEILKEEGLIPMTKGISLNYKTYDWTLDLDNFIDL